MKFASFTLSLPLSSCWVPGISCYVPFSYSCVFCVCHPLRFLGLLRERGLEVFYWNLGNLTGTITTEQRHTLSKQPPLTVGCPWGRDGASGRMLIGWTLCESCASHCGCSELGAHRSYGVQNTLFCSGPAQPLPFKMSPPLFFSVLWALGEEIWYGYPT